MTTGATIDFDAALAESKRNRTCAECGIDLDHRTVPRSAFCSDQCRYRFRDRRRYAESREAQRERSRRYFAAHRDAVLERAAAKRGRSRPPVQVECSECGEPLTGRQRLVCSPRCRDARYRRLHPEAYAAKQRRKVARRRERRREGGS